MKGFKRRGDFPPKIASLRFQTSQHEGQKIHDSSRTFQSKIHPNGPELALEENQNPTARSNVVQSERGNQRDGLWLAHEDLAMHSNRSNAVGF